LKEKARSDKSDIHVFKTREEESSAGTEGSPEE
jgi:hypothetical protein